MTKPAIKVLIAVKLDCHSGIRTEKIDLHVAAPVKGDGKLSVQEKSSDGLGQGLEPPEEKRFRGAPGLASASRVRRWQIWMS
jgi:hypothetical protein